jgi:hypothetical protein
MPTDTVSSKKTNEKNKAPSLWQNKRGAFASQNRHFCKPKWALLQAEMGTFENEKRLIRFANKPLFLSELVYCRI